LDDKVEILYKGFLYEGENLAKEEEFIKYLAIKKIRWKNSIS
jgi:hypothetical protein